MSQPLSPAAQAVDTALAACIQLQGEIIRARPLASAALRAAADQVVPEDLKRYVMSTTEAIRLNRASTRAQLLAIAAELEADR
jgi:propanediol dehydratase small subunit